MFKIFKSRDFSFLKNFGFLAIFIGCFLPIALFIFDFYDFSDISSTLFLF